ncbi:Cas10/Cmr2 second palm domain-containing protein [Coleofasciculus sp.]|uniref:Cas10/Cmr2 second palm domain-containing protein n=1 Tax=Coleofasciculus sp. TaxID=3100458 RepID=UPI003A227A91
MNLQDWLIKQKNLYPVLPQAEPLLSTHPVSGEWQNSSHLKNQVWWGGGASQEACQQIDLGNTPTLTQIGVISFGPVQSFLGGGQRLRDWAVASWLCHYLSAVLIYRWEEWGGKVLLPLHHSSPLVNWLRGSNSVDQRFWRPELPNVVTGVFPESDSWLEKFQSLIQQEWGRLLKGLEQAAIAHKSQLLNGIGWRVIHRDHQCLWSVYTESTPIRVGQIVEDIANLHQGIESQKLGRDWQGTWWGGRTSPSAGHLSIWHPGLQPIDQGGTWGLEKPILDQWWERAAKESKLKGLFSESDRLNSIEMLKRLASVPDIIVPTLKQLWGKTPPDCPWGQFPDRTAAAAAWIPTQPQVNLDLWNQTLQGLERDYFSTLPQKTQWGMPRADQNGQFAHPRGLERRNIEDKELLEIWQSDIPNGWQSTIEWTVGWRGDGDNMGKWLSGKQYRTLKLPWSKWHPNAEQITHYNLGIQPPNVPNQDRQLELPHILDLSLLFSLWNELLYALTEVHHDSKVIFAGGDDFLLLGPLTEAISLTHDLQALWTGKPSPLTQPLTPPVDGWVQYQDQLYPVPGEKMHFSLGIVIAQRRIPQSLWHRGLNQAYKQAKSQGRNRICIQVLFNSGQSLQWVCPWSLWNLLMPIEPTKEGKSELNAWEKLLTYLESTRLRDVSIFTVGDLIDTLWVSVGIPLTWEQVLTVGRRDYQTELKDWSWWINWISLKAFLARQQRERQKWLEQVSR